MRRNFCGVSENEFDRRGFESLTEDFPIEKRLDGASKPYDTVALVCALMPDDAASIASAATMFPFRTARHAGNIYLFNDARHLVPATPFIDILQETLTAVIRSKASGFARYRPARSEDGPLARGVSFQSISIFAKQ